MINYHNCKWDWSRHHTKTPEKNTFDFGPLMWHSSRAGAWASTAAVPRPLALNQILYLDPVSQSSCCWLLRQGRRRAYGCAASRPWNILNAFYSNSLSSPNWAKFFGQMTGIPSSDPVIVSGWCRDVADNYLKFGQHFSRVKTQQCAKMSNIASKFTLQECWEKLRKFQSL